MWVDSSGAVFFSFAVHKSLSGSGNFLPFCSIFLVLHASIYESDQKFSTGKDNKSSSEPHDLFIRSSFDSGVIRKNAFIN